MVDSRLRVNPPSLFHCFVHVTAPGLSEVNQIEKSIPEEFEEKELILKGIPDFCFPCTINYDGVQYSTFVLTDLDSRFRFGFCRYPPHARHCLCIVSYFPWFQTFYAVLDKVAQINVNDHNFKGLTRFLEVLNQQEIPTPGSKLSFHFNDENSVQHFRVTVPDTSKLPRIPDNRNLTEYFAKVSPENMVNLFISMLFERRIIITSDKLSVLTAVVHGSVSLLYPMQWQHIYIPILPAHLLDYCCAPMPFLLGVHASMMEKVRNMPLSEVVIFDADQNEMYMMTEDLEKFPSRISSRLKRKLRHIDRALADYVSRQFLYSLADLIGGYRDALKVSETSNGDEIVFDDELFITSRSGHTKVFLENILNQQSFRQFIAGRLDMLNKDHALEDVFEEAINKRNLDVSNETKYSQLKDKMKKGGGAIKKGGAVLKKSVDGSYSHLKVMAGDIDTKELKKKFKDKMKDGYKGVMQMGHKDSSGDDKEEKVNSPNLKGLNKRRHKSLYHKQDDVTDVRPKIPPPRPPRPSSEYFSQVSTDSAGGSTRLTRKYAMKERTTSRSDQDIPSIASDISSQNRSVDNSSESSSLFESGLAAYSDTDSSNERLDGYQNPAFNDPNCDLLFSTSIDDEDVTLEQTPIRASQPYEKHVNQMVSPLPDSNVIIPSETLHDMLIPSSITPTEQQASIKQFDSTGPFYNPATDFTNKENNIGRKPSLARKKHVTGSKPIVPPRPLMTQLSLDKISSNNMSPGKPVVPHRPPQQVLAQFKSQTSNIESRDLFLDSDSSDSSNLNKSYLADITFEDDPLLFNVHNTSPVSPLPSSETCGLPSSDLLGLDQSLFHETMQSLSDDTRSLMTTGASNGSRHDSYPNYQKSKAFFESPDFFPNYNLGSNFVHHSNNPNSLTGVKVVNSTSNDVFTKCLEEAKDIKYTPR